MGKACALPRARTHTCPRRLRCCRPGIHFTHMDMEKVDGGSVFCSSANLDPEYGEVCVPR
eukprot:3638400-Rhodomonas_salina.2